jgi:predicted aspartyl protease
MNHVEAQMIYTKDGHEIGLKEEILPYCVKSARESLSKVPGVQIEPEIYCNCALDLIYPNLTFAEIELAVKQNEIETLFTREDNFQIIMKCLEGNITYDENLKISSDNHPNFNKKHFINRCMQEIAENMVDTNEITQNEAFDYCTCTIERLLNTGYTYEEWLKADDESSFVYNEIIVSCADQYISDRIPKNQYASKDIIGQSSMSEIPLVEVAGLGYKIKINLDGITRYFLLDTGSSELIIDRELERELLINGAIKKENYLSKTTFKIANNQVVPVQLIKLDHVQIGDYTANNVIIGVIEEGSLLCGIGFLNKFKNWKIDESRKKLILYR